MIKNKNLINLFSKKVYNYKFLKIENVLILFKQDRL